MEKMPLPVFAEILWKIVISKNYQQSREIIEQGIDSLFSFSNVIDL